jgi:hypothetical protein
LNCFVRACALSVTATALACLLRAPALADGSTMNVSTAQPSPSPTPQGSVNISEDGKWHFAVSPYVWVPSINGTFEFPVPGAGAKAKPATIDLHEPPTSYVPHINALTMITSEVRRNNAVASFDYIWMNISTQKAAVKNVTSPDGNVIPISANAGLRVTANIWTVEGGATVAHSDDATVETLVGVRTFNLNTALNWNLSVPVEVLPQSGSVAKSGTVSDVVAAVRGKIRLGKRFFFPYYFDGGYGSKSSTVQAAGGIAYDVPWGNVTLLYRGLIYNANPVSLNQRLTFNGVSIGTTFRF